MDYQEEHIHKAALSILKTLQAHWGADHEFSPVKVSDFPHLSHRFYNRIQKQMESLGMKVLGDIEDLNIKAVKPDPRTFIRVAVTDDGYISGATYHAKPKFPWPLLCFFFRVGPLKIFEFESEFENGIILSTTIANKKNAGDTPENHIHQFCHPRSSVKDVFEYHKNKIKEIFLEHNSKPLELNTLDEICESQNRGIRNKRKYMEEIGWISREQLVKQLGKDDDFLDKVHKEVDRLVRKQLITGKL